VFLFPSVILLVNSRCSSLILNHHFINHFIISLTVSLLQCYFNSVERDHMCSEQCWDFAVHDRMLRDLLCLIISLYSHMHFITLKYQ